MPDMEMDTINSAAFIIRDEAGNLKAAGIVNYKKLGGAVETTISTFTRDFAEKMVKNMPPGGYRIVDAFSGGRVELITIGMDNSIPYKVVTISIDKLRDHFGVPFLDEPAPKAIAVKPSPVKS